ncbi:hypothetical protein C0J52_06909 [Blattella germanica]|nr:hypothetical protein C0J52_06909 [Blattella germanica]
MRSWSSSQRVLPSTSLLEPKAEYLRLAMACSGIGNGGEGNGGTGSSGSGSEGNGGTGNAGEGSGSSGSGGSGSSPTITCPDPQPAYSVYFPDPKDCTIFYECNAGVPYQLSCPTGLHFNPIAHVCDLPELAGCSHDIVETTPGAVQTTVEEVETPPQQPSTVTPTVNPGDQTTSGGGNNGGSGSAAPISCPNPQPGYTVYLPDPNDCSIFYECNAGVPYQLNCPAGLHFNPVAHVCDIPELAGSGLHFNPVAHVCDIPELAGCKNGGIETTPGAVQTTAEEVETSPQQPSTVTPTANPGDQTTSGGSGPISCPETQPGYTVYIPDPNDCSIFYECSFGVPYQLSCPVGLHFNPVSHICDTPEHAGCSHQGIIHTTSGAVQTTVEEVKTTPERPSTVTPTVNPGDQTTSGSAVTNDPSSVCPTAPEPSCPYTNPDESVFFPHPTDNHFFFHCSYGVPWCKICPAGLIWHQELLRCDF